LGSGLFRNRPRSRPRAFLGFDYDYDYEDEVAHYRILELGALPRGVARDQGVLDDGAGGAAHCGVAVGAVAAGLISKDTGGIARPLPCPPTGRAGACGCYSVRWTNRHESMSMASWCMSTLRSRRRRVSMTCGKCLSSPKCRPRHVKFGKPSVLAARVHNSVANGGIWRPVLMHGRGGKIVYKPQDENRFTPPSLPSCSHRWPRSLPRSPSLSKDGQPSAEIISAEKLLRLRRVVRERQHEEARMRTAPSPRKR